MADNETITNFKNCTTQFLIAQYFRRRARTYQLFSAAEKAKLNDRVSQLNHRFLSMKDKNCISKWISKTSKIEGRCFLVEKTLSDQSRFFVMHTIKNYSRLPMEPTYKNWRRIFCFKSLYFPRRNLCVWKRMLVS